MAASSGGGGPLAALLRALQAAALDPRLLKSLLVAGAPLRLVLAANLWMGRSLKCARLLACAGGGQPRALLPSPMPRGAARLLLSWRVATACPSPRPTSRTPCTRTLTACRAIAAELARRALELAGWLFGRLDPRRLRGFERAYFPLRRWHALLGELSAQCQEGVQTARAEQV